MSEKHDKPKDYGGPEQAPPAATTSMVDVLTARAQAKVAAAPIQGISPANISLWLQIIQAVIAAFSSCKSTPPAGIHQSLQSPGLLQRLRLRKRLQSALGTKLFRTSGDQLSQVLLDTGKEATLDEFSQFYQEATK